MAEGEIDNLTMEQYLALTRGNQALGVVKPEIGGIRVLDIVSLFNIPGVSHDAVMLRVFPITLTGAAKRWVDRLPPRTVDSWDLLKMTFIQRHRPPSRISKQLEEIRNFKQVNIFYNGLGAMNRQLLDSQGPITGMTPVQALTIKLWPPTPKSGMMGHPAEVLKVVVLKGSLLS
ncbi:hypothetical protein Tco_0598812 [Tanacetum coccineum]